MASDECLPLMTTDDLSECLADARGANRQEFRLRRGDQRFRRLVVLHASAHHGAVTPPQVCCVLDSPAFEMALPNTSGAGHSTAVPALYLPLALGQLLEAQCDPHARATSPQARATSPHARATSVGGGTATAGAAAAAAAADHGTAPALSACSALLYEEEVPVGRGRWDSSAPLIWLLATRCAAR